MSNTDFKDFNSNSKASAKLFVIADIQAPVSIRAVVSTPSISTFPSLAGPMSRTSGSGLWYSGAGIYPSPRGPPLFTFLLIVDVIALGEPVAVPELGLGSESGWHCPVGEEYHPVLLLPRSGFPN